MATRFPSVRPFLARLARDARGNTIAIVAAATLPIAGMVGSAVDMGRSYLIKTRLQQACDAGVLAGRKAMSGSTLDSAAEQQAENFFSTNFASNTAGATNVAFEADDTSDGQVTGTATARIPLSIMQMFGLEYITLNVECDAKLEVSNSDVMLVLDVTGSMSACPNGTECNSGSGSKIVGLRQAVMDFYDTMEAATSSDARFRLGFTAYSASVNVGIDPFTNDEILDNSWVVDSWTYQSRVANMTKPGWHPTTTYNAWTDQTHGSTISNSNCTKYGNNQSFSGFNPNPSGNPTLPTNDVFSAGQPATVNQVFYERVTGSYSGNKSCTRRYRTATTSYAQNGLYGFTSWSYMPVTYDVSDYRAGNTINVYTANSPPTGAVTASGAYDMVALVNSTGSTVTGVSTSFDGCVEERDTVAQSSYATIPSGAYDLDILTTPSSTATRWRPMWNELVYDRSGTANELNVTTNRSPVTSYCPAESSKLAERTRTQVQSYVDSLLAVGNTYHDLGMAWGARMLSATGMWASENSTAPNGRSISRHLIFMTDGDMVTPPNIYNSHGYEELDRRVSGASVTPSQNDLINRHNARFLALCAAAKANNVTVWTVAFGTANPPTLISCADSGKAYTATNSAALRAQFQVIASQIADLRLSR